MSIRNEQQEFWARSYANEYIKKNSQFDEKLGIEGWSIMLRKATKVDTILECGCNIGRNVNFLKALLPSSEQSVIEISKPAFEYVTTTYKLKSAFNGAIVDADFGAAEFDLTFTCGVLIHIHPKDLISNMQKLYEFSSRYILIAEYFNRTDTMLEYQGEKDKLFKCDFGKKFMQNFQVELIDNGFLWGHIYDNGGFDDVTWWLFEKK